MKKSSKLQGTRGVTSVWSGAGALVCVAIVCATSASADTSRAPLFNGIVAAVDGRALTLLDLRKFRKVNEPFMPADSDAGYVTYLNGMLETEMLREEFAVNGITATDADVEIYIERLLAQNNQTQESIREALVRSGLQWTDYFERMRQEVQRLALINNVIRSRVSVSPEDVERAWRSDPKFLQPQRFEISHIYLGFPRGASSSQRIDTRRRADEIYADVANGRGFESAARKYSMGPTADDGGVLGAFAEGSMAPHFEEALEGLKPGQVAKPIETADGIHIVKLDEVLPPERRPLDEVQDALREELYEKKLNDRFERWASKDLREKHYIEIKLDELALAAAL